MSDSLVDGEIYRWWMKQFDYKEMIAGLKRDRGHKCEKCGKVGDVQAHHISYDWMMTPHEHRTILLVCRECHKKIHDIE